MISGDSGLAHDAVRQLARIQELCVRMYFDDALCQRWTMEQGEVCRELGLGLRARTLVPETTSAAFQAESHGRRFLIAREVGLRFPNTLRRMFGRPVSPVELSGSPEFLEFLASDYFLTARWALPHPDGMGEGYEANSKFFSWLIERASLSEPTCDLELRTLAFVELARHLVGCSRSATCEPYSRFALGAFFRVDPGTERRLVVIWKTADVRVVDTRGVQHPGALGLCDMDAWLLSWRARWERR